MVILHSLSPTSQLWSPSPSCWMSDLSSQLSATTHYPATHKHQMNPTTCKPTQLTSWIPLTHCCQLILWHRSSSDCDHHPTIRPDPHRTIPSPAPPSWPWPPNQTNTDPPIQRPNMEDTSRHMNRFSSMWKQRNNVQIVLLDRNDENENGGEWLKTFWREGKGRRWVMRTLIFQEGVVDGKRKNSHKLSSRMK